MNTIEQTRAMEQNAIAQSRGAIARFLNPQQYAESAQEGSILATRERAPVLHERNFAATQGQTTQATPLMTVAKSLMQSAVANHPLTQHAKAVQPAASDVVRRYPLPVLAIAGLAGAAMVYNPALRKRAAALLVTSAAAGGVALRPILGRVAGDLLRQFSKR